MPGAAGDLSRPAGRAHRLGAAHPRGVFHQAARPWARCGTGATSTRRGRPPPRACRPPGGCRPAPPCISLECLEGHLEELRRQLLAAARRLTGARVLAARLYGVGPVTALAITCWLGGAGRFSSSRKAVRFAGLDITVYSSDGRRLPGRLSRQGPAVLRWAVYGRARPTPAPGAPDHDYYAQVKDRLDGKRAALSEARKIIRQACHILAELGDDALAAA